MTTETRTILISDIVGSTELMSRMDDGAHRKLRIAHFTALREQIGHHGGVVVKNLGDGVMATFASARAAVDCSIALQRAMGYAGRREALPRVDIRVGVSTGDVSVEEGDCFGVAVVEASRVCEQARGGQVLLTAATRLLARPYEPLVSVGNTWLKGLPGPVELWTAPWAPDDAPPVRVVLADDSVLVRQGIARVLEDRGLEVLAQAGDGSELLRLTESLRPDLAIVDIRMPPTYTIEGLEAAEELLARHPHMRVLLLSQEIEPAYAERLIATRSTGVGYLLKQRVSDVQEFTVAAKRVAAGGVAFEDGLLRQEPVR